MTTKFSEMLHAGFEQTFDVAQMLVDEDTQFQNIKIFDTPLNGRVMTLDNIVQITTKDEYTYSEMLSHVPICALLAAGKTVKRVLIVGGGDAAIAEEVLKHKGVERVDMAEIDPRVIELCREHFSDVNRAAFADERFNIHVGDAFEWLKRPESEGAYDVIIADRPDPVGPAEVLFADAFYERVAAALTPHGVAVFQTGVPFYQPKELAETGPQLAKAFSSSGVYLTVTTTYTGGHMALTWASNGFSLDKPEAAALAKAANALPTDYYSADMHVAAFALPPYMQRILKGDVRIPGEQVGESGKTLGG